MDVVGKELFPLCGEFNQSLVRRLLTGEELPAQALEAEIPVRPPVMCCWLPPPGTVLRPEAGQGLCVRRYRLLYLRRQRPLGMMDTCVCMGASVSSPTATIRCWGKKREKIRGGHRRLHVHPLRITGLIDIAYNQLQFRGCGSG